MSRALGVWCTPSWASPLTRYYASAADEFGIVHGMESASRDAHYYLLERAAAKGQKLYNATECEVDAKAYRIPFMLGSSLSADLRRVTCIACMVAIVKRNK
jgi:hypothetical protein